MEWAIIGKFAKTYWSQIALGLLVLGLSISLGVTRHTLSVRTDTLHNTEAAYTNFQKEVKLKTEAATLADAKHAADIHAKDEAIRISNEHSLQDRLDAANADAIAYANQLRHSPSGDTRRGGSPSVSPAANPSGPAVDPGPSPVVDDQTNDLKICAENTVKAQGWLDWYGEVKAVPDRQ
jgi:hypothetical protein